MKYTVKYFITLFASLFCLGNLWAGQKTTAEILQCETRWNNELSKISLPISAGNIGEIDEMKVCGQYFQVRLMLNKELEMLVDSSYLEKLNETARQYIINQETKNVEGLVTDELGLRLIYKSKETGRSLATTLSSAEVKELVQQGSNTNDKDKKEWAIKKMQAYIDAANKLCPTEVDEFSRLDRLELNKKSVDYYYTVSETEDLTIKDLKKYSKETMHQSIISSLSGSQIQTSNFIKYLLTAGYTLNYIYIGSMTGKKMEISISRSELEYAQKEILQNAINAGK